MIKLGDQQVKELRNKVAELARLKNGNKVFTDASHGTGRPKLCDGVLEVLKRICELIGESHRWFTKNVVRKVYNNAIKKLRAWRMQSNQRFFREFARGKQEARIYRPNFRSGRRSHSVRMAA